MSFCHLSFVTLCVQVANVLPSRSLEMVEALYNMNKVCLVLVLASSLDMLTIMIVIVWCETLTCFCSVNVTGMLFFLENTGVLLWEMVRELWHCIVANMGFRKMGDTSNLVSW